MAQWGTMLHEGPRGEQMRCDKSVLIPADKLFPNFLSLPLQLLPAIQPGKADIRLVSS